jgi:hypothetical protein
MAGIVQERITSGIKVGKLGADAIGRVRADGVGATSGAAPWKRRPVNRPFSVEACEEVCDPQHAPAMTLSPETSRMDDLADVAAEAVVRGHAEPVTALRTKLHDTPRL